VADLRGHEGLPPHLSALASKLINWAVFKYLCRKTRKKTMPSPPKKILDPPLGIYLRRRSIGYRLS